LTRILPRGKTERMTSVTGTVVVLTKRVAH
jgi:hypothetical protein